MELRTNRLFVVSSILLIASVSNPSTIQAGQPERAVVHRAQSIRNQAPSTSYHEGRIIEFDAPGAAKVETAACDDDGGCGTYAQDINAAGAILGGYTDSYLVPHGLIRERDGRFLSFDAPGAGLGHGLDEGNLPDRNRRFRRRRRAI